MKNGFTVYGCDEATYQKSVKLGKPPTLKKLSQTYSARSAAEAFMNLARSQYAKLEIRQS